MIMESRRYRRRQLKKRRRRKRLFFVLFVLGILAVLIFRPTRKSFQPQTASIDPQKIHRDILGEVVVADTTGRELTTREKLSDFEILTKTLTRSHPAFRSENAAIKNFLESESDYKNRITATKDDQEFYRVLNDYIALIDRVDTKLIDADDYRLLQGEFPGKTTPWAKILSDSRVEDRYDRMELINPSKADSGLVLDIPVEGKVAYIKVANFNADYSEDAKKILNFLKTLKDIPFIVIDVRGNQGLCVDYWMEAIVSPLRKNSLTYRGEEYFSPGAFDEEFAYLSDPGLSRSVSFSKSTSSGSQGAHVKTSSTLSLLPSVKKITVSTLPTEQVSFYGSIFILQDAGVFHAADLFCKFANATGFAETVGRPSGGGASFSPPALVALPHSGLLICMPLGISVDGTSLLSATTKPKAEMSPTADSLNKLFDIIELE